MVALSEDLSYVVFACAAAGIGCACMVRSRLRMALVSRHRSGLSGEGVPLDASGAGLAPRIVRYAAMVTQRLTCGMPGFLRGSGGTARVERWLADHARRAGVDDAVSAEGFCEARFRLAAGGAALGGLVGLPLSTELAVALLLVGAVAGFSAVRRSVVAVERRRSAELERNLSEMLEVVALGLRSGLTFDRSFQLYGSHFDSSLAHACAKTQRRWTLGLMTREEALRDLAESYSSSLLSRVIESAVRSLRFGSSLSESFEAAALEARAVHRAHIEEKVAKAPVKMMIPTGTLILPAMLLLVLGPVLLELMAGF